MIDWLADYCARRAERLTTYARVAYTDGDYLSGNFYSERASSWSAASKWFNARTKNAVVD